VIASFLLAAALAAAPAPESAQSQVSVAPNPARLDLPITLRLKDASVVDVLEKLADLLGVTPILDPRVGGRVSLDVRNLPISEAIEHVERAARVEITVSARLLRVRTTADSGSAGPAPAPATAHAAPRTLGETVRFWLDGAGGPPVTVRVPGYVGRVDLPGCAGPVTVGRLGAYGGRTVGIALASSDAEGGPARGRILGEAAIDGAKVLLPGCDGRLVAEVGDPLPGTTVTEPVRVPKGEPLVVTMRLLELTEEKEEGLAEPKIAFPPDGSFSVTSGFTAGAPESFGQEAEIHGVPLEVRPEEESILLAVYAGVTRAPATADGRPTLVARRAESLRLRKGRPVRWTVDSSWDGGRAAIVLELTLARVGAAVR
jgi:hypothetical protein